METVEYKREELFKAMRATQRYRGANAYMVAKMQAIESMLARHYHPDNLRTLRCWTPYLWWKVRQPL